MTGLSHCLLVVLCCASFALNVFGDDSDFIDEKGKALKNFKGKCNYDVVSCSPCGFTDKRKHCFDSVSGRGYKLERALSVLPVGQ